MLQLHGDEGPAYCREAARRTGCKIDQGRARARRGAGAGAAASSTPTSTCSTPTRRKAPGGTGESFDWELARLHPGTPPVVLSGGLTPDNVAEAIAAARPFAVDTASGTEAEPGRKDPAKLDGVLPRGRGSATPVGGRVSAPAIERRFGPYGGRYVPETLIPALDELERAWLAARDDPAFAAELDAAAARLRRTADAALPRARASRRWRAARCG